MEIKDLIGIKYTVHGRTLEEGLDCYGVVFLYYKEFKGIKLIDPFYEDVTPEEKSKVGKVLIEGLPVEKIENPEIDCLVSIVSGGKLAHIGVYLGNGQLLHSTKETGCIISDIQRYSNRIGGFYRVRS